MMSGKMTKQRGIALIQVLLITLIIMLLAVYFTQTARNQISQTINVERRIEAQLMASSVLNQVLFASLSNDVYVRESLLPGYWEWLQDGYRHYFLDGTPVSITPNVVIKIKDTGGLLPVQYPYHPAWPVFLQRYGLDPQQIRLFQDTLNDFQDGDYITRLGTEEPALLINDIPYLNAPIEHVMWVRLFLQQWPMIPVEDFLANTHVINAYRMSVRGMNIELLRTIFGHEAGHYIHEQLQQGKLSSSQFAPFVPEALTSEDLGLFPTLNRRLHVQVENGDVLWTQQIDVNIHALQAKPYTIIGNNN